MIIVAAFVLFAGAAVVAVTAGATGTLSVGRRWVVDVCWLGHVAGAVLCIVAGVRGLRGHPGDVHLGTAEGLGTADLRCDSLSGLFLVISFGVATPVMLAAVRSGHGARSRLPAPVGLIMIAALVILTAESTFVFLFGWELLTVGFYLAVGFDRHRRARARSSVSTIVFGRSSGAFLLVGMLLIATRAGNGFDFSAWRIGGGAAADAGYALILAGFALKIGLVPVHVWLPDAYSSAPPVCRALLAGAAVNVGFYGMWRTLDLLGAPPVWLACTVLVLGGVSAIYGIAQAAVNPRLPTLIAWSSVENSGIITAGFGVALTGAIASNHALVATGLVAATAQVITHAVAKTLLFLSTASVEEATGATDMDAIGGVAHRLPWTGAGLTIGALTLAGLPLTAGFTSEWLTLEALMQQFRLVDLSMQLCITAAGVLVALTVGVAALTFVRLVALTAFGPDRLQITNPVALADNERNVAFRLSVSVLAFAALALSAVAPLLMRVISAGITPVAGAATAVVRQGPWVIQPAFGGFSALSPSWLWIVLPAMTVVIALGSYLLSSGRLIRVRRVDAWSSASPGVDRQQGYTSFAFANPMRTVLENMLRTRRSNTSGDLAGRDVTYRIDVIDVIDRRLYAPAIHHLAQVARYAKRLQSGRLDAYLSYMLIALLAVLAVAVATS